MQNSAVFKEAVSTKRLLNVVKEVSSFHRIQASPTFRMAAEKVLQIAKGYGLDAKILEYEADPDVWYMQSKMFKEWSIKAATLDLVDPEMRLADFSEEAISVVQKSHPIDRRNDPVDLVLLDKGADEKDYEDVDLKGKFVFTRTHLNTVDWVYKKGAIGVVTDFIMATKNRSRADLYRSLTYTSYWYVHDGEEEEYRGFVLSPEAGDKLADLCKEKWQKDQGYLQIRPFIDSSLYNGHIQDVEVTLPGKDDKIVLLAAHLCHPKTSANDNASGVSATLEAMNVIARLVKEGKIEQPQHTIKLLLMPEMTGTYPYLCDYDNYDNFIGAMNLDMVGGRQTRFYGPITLTKTPLALANLANEMSTYALKEAGKEAYSLSDALVNMTNFRIEPFSGGSDHIIYCDPTIGIPCCMLGQWPDLNYHTATDTLDVIDPSVLKFSCLTAINYAYNLANMKEEDLPYLFEELDLNMTTEKNRLVREYLEGNISKDMFGSTMFKYKEYYIDCVKSAKRFVEDAQTEAVEKKIAAQFDNWISFYDLKDSYQVENNSKTVYRRKFIGPIQRMGDYKGIGYGDVLKKYYASLNGKDRFAMMDLESSMVYYMDGKMSLSDLVKEISLDLKKDVSKEADILIDCLLGLNLIEVVE